MPTLTVTEPSETSQRYEISPNRETVLMGRSSKSDVRISCPSVSGTHAKIRKLGDGYVLRDLGSTNGIKLDGKRVSEIQLKRGQRIQLGDVKLVFEPDFAEDDRSDTQKIDREPLPEIETKSGSKPASRPGAKSGPEAEAEAQDNPVTTGLALLGGGLIVIGLLALIGVEAIKAIPDRGSFALFSGGILIGSGLLCFVGILFANGTIRVPRLVLQYNED
ncbi:MAG: FHA domain-containing protein, partial [Akkermansiaceae bacterium]|nr:FHA domain-containing protein [Akkermansiaceae bacterium]